MQMRDLTRRGVVAGVGLTPFLASAAASAQAAKTAMNMAAATADPYSYVDPQFVTALRAAAPNFEAVDAGNLARLRARGALSPAADEPRPSAAKAPGRNGAPDVPVLVFDPNPDQKNKPAVLYIHGGGYVMGQAGTSLRLAQDIAQGVGALVVSVDYTLAPEARFPVSLEQNYAALAWLHGNAATLGADPARIAVMGDSAGGGHAAMLAIAARDRGEIKLAYQCLIYPMLDDRTGSTRRVPPHIGHFIWTEGANRFGWTSLLGVPAGSASVPAGAVPARLKDVSGLPPTFIGVGSIDLFLEEDIDYARRLAMAGVGTELMIVPGAYHGFDVLARDAKLTVQFRGAWQAALRRALQS